MPIFRPRIKLYRKLLYRKGYRVHSPFTYNLITKVIEEKSPYYAFEEIESLRKRILAGHDEIARITAREAQSSKYGALLFRLVNFFKCHTVLQFGGSTGIMSLYLAMASPRTCRCIVWEERKGIGEKVNAFVEEIKLKNLHLQEGAWPEVLELPDSEDPEPTLVFINLQERREETVKALRLVFPLLREDSIVVIDGIHANREMKLLWKELREDSNIRVTMDLYSLGLLFFDKKLHKRNYKNYFDDGKKQNLHPDRRRRLHLPGRRKKGSEKQPPNRSIRDGR